MAKMRGIKPETFTDDKILQVSPTARWLFVGMWTQACDNGHLDNNHIQLKVRLLPMDNVEVSELVQELSTTGLLEDRGEYLAIPNMPKHQKIDRRFIVFCKWCDHDENSVFSPSDKLKRNTSTRRAPDEQQERSTDSTSSTRRAPDEHPTSTQRSPVDEGEGEGEGEGESEVNPPSPPGGGNGRGDAQQPIVEVEQPAPPAPKRKTRPASNAHNTDPEFAKFWEVYPLKKSKKAAHSAYLKALDIVDLETLIAGAASYRDDPSRNPDKTKHPSTWLNQHCWEDEPGPAVPPANWIPNQYPAMSASDRRLAEVQEREQQILAGEYQHLTSNQPYAPLRAIEGGKYLG